MFRQSGPSTSKAAAKKHRPVLSKRRWLVLELVRRHNGWTSGELSRQLYHEKGSQLGIRASVETPHKRLPELEELGYVYKGPERQCRDSKYEAVTWWINQKGVDFLNDPANQP